ncbi:hypothetical protein HIM_09333 [Hirsutella minnesotensis 3608]|uniref:Uncharacterized protein n=1 Tax=Hirsutella minnesotensis 3608 TaxID=1043627 RepID=A0A0F7ZLM4_9HYPO|nr:hypothetical protein HIM_09333 [Hirsutella minnesotensis 3608]
MKYQAALCFAIFTTGLAAPVPHHHHHHHHHHDHPSLVSYSDPRNSVLIVDSEQASASKANANAYAKTEASTRDVQRAAGMSERAEPSAKKGLHGLGIAGLL